jgi:hypothetical protein
MRAPRAPTSRLRPIYINVYPGPIGGPHGYGLPCASRAEADNITCPDRLYRLRIIPWLPDCSRVDPPFAGNESNSAFASARVEESAGAFRSKEPPKSRGCGPRSARYLSPLGSYASPDCPGASASGRFPREV